MNYKGTRIVAQAFTDVLKKWHNSKQSSNITEASINNKKNESKSQKNAAIVGANGI